MTTEFQALLGQLDTGTDSCIFNTVLDGHGDKKNYVSYFLGFASQLKHRASEVRELIADYHGKIKAKDAPLHSQLVTYSVAQWIFHTNKIEFAGLDSGADTQALITGQRLTRGTVGDKEVLQTLELLKQTYSPDSNLQKRAFSANDLKRWHSVLFKSVLESPGAFRTTGVKTNNPDNTEHIYPHHGTVMRGTLGLAQIVSRLAAELNTDHYDESEKLLYTFALAAFAQYHFVDIHPFVDGNGRMCRFLSKFVLDACCPLPFPMFIDRDSYLAALVSGRKERNPTDAPLALARLLLDSAATFYRDTVKTYSNRPFGWLLIASDEVGFRAVCKAELINDADTDTLARTFTDLQVGHGVDLHIGEKVFRVKKYCDIDDL